MQEEAVSTPHPCKKKNVAVFFAFCFFLLFDNQKYHMKIRSTPQPVPEISIFSEARAALGTRVSILYIHWPDTNLSHHSWAHPEHYLPFLRPAPS